MTKKLTPEELLEKIEEYGYAKYAQALNQPDEARSQCAILSNQLLSEIKEQLNLKTQSDVS